MGKTRVLLVEDSLTIRRRFAEVLGADPEIEIVGEAEDGKRATVSNPVIPGISTSTTKRSKDCRRATSSASSPELAVATS